MQIPFCPHWQTLYPLQNKSKFSGQKIFPSKPATVIVAPGMVQVTITDPTFISIELAAALHVTTKHLPLASIASSSLAEEIMHLLPLLNNSPVLSSYPSLSKGS